MTKTIDASLEKEARRPRLRTASVLFGIAAVSTSASAATHYALCDRDGAPACGNIGQLGREAPPPPAPVVEPARPITNTTVTHNAPLVSVTITTKLVAPPPSVNAGPRDPLGPEFIDTVARPLTDLKREYAAGNVMGKRPSGRRD
jgi:hypothetical protein